MNDVISFKHSCAAGDLLSTLPGIKRICELENKKAVIYQRLGMIALRSNEDAEPFKDETGQPICMNEYMFDMLKPLLLSQTYIKDFVVYEGQEVGYDLDKTRYNTFTNMPQGNINRWLFYVYPRLAANLSKRWLVAPFQENGEYIDKIIINLTARYRNHFTNYFFLKKYESDIIFTGLFTEYDKFCETWKLSVPFVQAKDCLELATMLNSCKFFLGNQSMCFQIAEGLKIPRILELCALMPNVIPCGENAYDFYHQVALEYYFEYLNNLIV